MKSKITLTKRPKKPNLKRFKKKLVATIIYNKDTARTFHDTSYYEALESEIKRLPLRKVQQNSYISPFRKKKVDQFLDYWRSIYVKKQNAMGNILKGIYNRNMSYAFNTQGGLPYRKHTNILSLISSPTMLAYCYKQISKNTGASTLGYFLSDKRYNSLIGQQKSYINKTFYTPDGINKYTFLMTSKLLKKGLYPWGASKRIYFEKPGRPGSLRPITIPPFMDRVVQKAITITLEAIFEPWFEKNNNSFGFRARKGVHDSIFCLTAPKTNSMTISIEGDIKAAYDRVCKEKLIQILSKYIQDKKFLELIKQRLNYQYFDTIKQKFIEEPIGIPQGGIDSPYLWNIYMLEFDNFVVKETDNIFNKLNMEKGKENNIYRNITRQLITCKFITNILNKYNNYEHINDILTIPSVRKEEQEKNPKLPKETHNLKKIIQQLGWQECYNTKSNLDLFKYKVIDLKGELTKKRLKIPPIHPNQQILKFVYSRYADDWILITNAPAEIAGQLKDKYKDFLRNELKAELSLEKTLITDITKQPAHFLGFELKTPRNNKISGYNRKSQSGRQVTVLSNTSNTVYAYPDKERLLNRLHMKGYCDKKGFPREIPWLSCLEPFIIIERFNSVLTGLANYYTEFVKHPNRSLSRWVYIIRYSCIKTLAQKHKCSIRKIFEKYSRDVIQPPNTKEKTVAASIQQKIDNKYYQKTWQLYTLSELIQMASNLKRKNLIATTYYSLEEGKPIEYLPPPPSPLPKGGSEPSVKDYSFLERIRWVNIRCKVLLDLPCNICGSYDKVEMHHLKHIKKTRYELIPEANFWEKVMSNKNRKQIPVCRECHMNLIHKGRYGGTNLKYLAPMVMYDDRLITISAHIKDSDKEYHSKTLQEKGYYEVAAPPNN